ncbi:hypothetical protein [Ornithinimicrobium pratense]|uniref:Uncharacterized protein n=1 Tax=Ornithinimicrobium pratense TaxID=2593973 RepID=A0A5J6V587_9MICO|nr:hypothetical protein [Ornithinimicrobium pratense]QFG68945.1 hypothetical protein FY030_09730 [Ornithinimicrobium pratense]
MSLHPGGGSAAAGAASAGGALAAGSVSPVLLVRPDELRQAGRLLRGVGEQVEELADRARQEVVDLGQAWTGLAALEQQARAAAVRELMRVTARPGRAAADALDRAAEVAASAGDRVRAWSRRVDDCRAELTTLQAMGPPPEPLLEQLWRRHLQEAEQELVLAQCLVGKAEREWRAVEQDVAAVVSTAWSVVTELNRTRQVLQPVLTSATKAWTTVRSAGLTTATAIALARARWQRSAPMRDLALRRARVWFRQLTTGKPGRGKDWTLVRKAKFVPGPVGWVFTYLGALDDVRTGGGYPGWRGDVTRFLAAGALAGGPLMLAGVALPPLGIAGVAAVSAYQAWTAGNLVWDNRGALVRYAHQAAEGVVLVDRKLDELRIRAYARLAEHISTLRDPRTWQVTPAGPRPRIDVSDALGPVLARLPDTQWLRERWRQVGEPLRLPAVPLPPVLPPLRVGTWPRLPGMP